MAVFAALAAAAGVCLLLTSPRRGPGIGGESPRLAAGRAGAPLGAGTVGDAQWFRLVASFGVGAAVWLLAPTAWAPGVAGLAGALTWWRSATWEPASVRRRRAAVQADLPHLVDLLGAALAAGAGPVEALARVAGVLEGPIAEELREPLLRLRLGADPVDVWTVLATHPQLGRLGTTLRRADESGAPVAEALGRLAEDLRSRRRADVEAQVRQVEVKAAVPLGVCLLPAFILLGVVPLVAGSSLALLGR